MPMLAVSHSPTPSSVRIAASSNGEGKNADAAIGASLALTVANDSTLAATDRDITTGGNVSFRALAAAASSTFASASASGAHSAGSGSSGDDPNAQATKQRGFGDHVASEQGVTNSGSTSSPQAESSNGAVTVAAAVGINIANSDARALLGNNAAINAGGSAELKATNNTDAHATADGSAVQGKVGIGAAVALNVGNNVAQARMGTGSQIHGKGASLEALMTAIPNRDGVDDVTNSMGASALSGAGGSDVGIAGAVAINVETSTAEAVVAAGALLDGGSGTVLMVAQNNTANVSSAHPLNGGGVGGDAGIGVSMALDLANNLTRAEVEDTGAVKTTGAGADVGMGAVGLHSADVSAEAGAASDGGFAVAPAVALAIENNDTHVRLGAGGAPMNIGGTLTGVAAHRSAVTTTAGGTAAGADAAIGASLALTVVVCGHGPSCLWQARMAGACGQPP